MKKPSGSTAKEYAKRINDALQFIDRNLAEEIPLARLASVACFSPYHFHRIFTALIGEPPAEYIRRLRLEKAAGMLILDPSSSVTQTALACGFSGAALFCRQFKERFGVSPTAWRSGGCKKSKKGQALSKKRKDGTPGQGAMLPARRWRMKNAPTVDVKDIPAFRVAYVKHMKGYEDSAGIADAFQKLFFWAGPRGVLSTEAKVLGISFDDPDITPKDKCRYYACVTVDERAEPDGEVGVMTMRPGKYAVARFSGGERIFKEAYGYIYGEWLPKSGWQPDDAPAFETYIEEPGAHEGTTTFTFDLCVPVKPL